jgi:hypothetical protein
MYEYLGICVSDRSGTPEQRWFLASLEMTAGAHCGWGEEYSGERGLGQEGWRQATPKSKFNNCGVYLRRLSY